MQIFSTCPSCRQEVQITVKGQTTHGGCPPPPITPVDQMFKTFEEMVARIAAPDYKPRQHDELNLDALKAKIDEIDAQPPRLGDAALIYAGWGWPVFPLRPVGAPCRKQRRDKCAALCQCPKTPATKHGFEDATTDVERIRRYWTANPNANIGLATGHAFDVIDVDLPDGPAQWEAMRNRPDLHGQVSTASGGLHAYITPTGKNNGARIWPGVDYRGLGGYVVAPPSWLGDHGHKWAWITKPSPRLTERTPT